MNKAGPSVASYPLSSPDIAKELVALIRGSFATPIICGLGRLGAVEVILFKPEFDADDFSNIPNKKLLGFALEYLVRIGLLEPASEKAGSYHATDLGREIFRRLSSFYAPHSYRDYLRNFQDQLQNTGPYQKQEVDRLENIIGSGRTHERYFPPAVSFLRRKVKFDLIVDIGCGDGRFLEFALSGIPQIKAVGIDLSEVSVKATKENLRKKFPDREIDALSADAGDVQKWSAPLLRLARQNRMAISMWFLLHEISQRDPEKVIHFLKEVHKLFPQSHLIVGELVRQDADILAQHRKELVMPEYLFFHDISLQGVLSWKEYQDVLKKIPYELLSERLFDEIAGPEGTKQPATFVWCLAPK